MAHATILITDDDPQVVRLLRSYLEQSGYDVLEANDGETALQRLQAAHPDLLILDLMLPDRDGWALTRAIRADERLAALPIIMLTARIDDMDKILGLELGADDYITKPFNPREVVARVNALLRRVQRESHNDARVLSVGSLALDEASRHVTVSGEAVDLTPTEFDLLRTMMTHPNYVFTRGELISKGLGYDYEGLERTLDSHIKNLRYKIEPDPKNPTIIQTVYGVGYRLSTSEDS